jgi:DNA-binding response OmpR family regulator
MLATILEYNLTAAGYRVRHLSNGGEVLRMVEEWRPDLMILDLTLPTIAGIEVLRRLRRDWPMRRLPALMLTSRTDPADGHRALSVGATGFIRKPFSLQELMMSIQHLPSPVIRMT